MRKLIRLILILSSFHFSCRNADKSEENANRDFKDSTEKIYRIQENSIEEKVINLDSTKALIQKQNITDSTSYTFTLEGNFSAEGNEGTAFYKAKKIDKIEITFYGETGKATYTYNFKGKLIHVSQQQFNYKTDFTEVKSKKDIMKGERINFTTDLNGKIINGHNIKADLDTFQELKKVVPFDLI